MDAIATGKKTVVIGNFERGYFARIAGGVRVESTNADKWTTDLISVRFIVRGGGVIVDMAVDSGGNVEGSKADETVKIGGVAILGLSNLPAQVSKDASQMYSSNLVNLVTEYWNEEDKQLNLDLNDEILQGCVITHGGTIVNETIKNLRGS